MLANFKVTISNKNDHQVLALFDTGATCLCVSHKLLDKLMTPLISSIKPIKFLPMTLKVNQADGQTSLELIGIALITIQLHQHTFTHPFVVCNQLKQSMLLGLDFARSFC